MSIAAVEYDGPELIDIETAPLNPVHTQHGHDMADASARHASSSHTRSLLVQQQKPGGCDNEDDDDDDDDDVGAGDADRAVNRHLADAAVRADNENLTAVGNGNKLFIFFSK